MVRDQDRLRAHAMLGLGEKVGGDPGRVRCPVGDHQHVGLAVQDHSLDLRQDGGVVMLQRQAVELASEMQVGGVDHG